MCIWMKKLDKISITDTCMGQKNDIHQYRTDSIRIMMIKCTVGHDTGDNR